MLPARLEFLIANCYGGMSYDAIAHSLDVRPMTLRRWRNGTTKIPRPVELLFELHRAVPQVTVQIVQRIICECGQRDRGERSVTE